MAAPADSNSASAIHENFEMNARKLQIPDSKLQRSFKHQACKSQTIQNRTLKLGIWNFLGAWSLEFGALCLIGFLQCVSNSAFASSPSVSLSALPLFFEPQETVVGDSSAYFARGQNYQFAITATGAQIALSKVESEQNEPSGHASRITHHASAITHHAARAIQMQLLGANAFAPLHGDGLLSGKMNYLVGNDPSQWRTDLPVFSRVQVDDVYPGINLIYYGNQHQLEYDFVIAPHAKPESIALHFDGVDKVEINDGGELVLSMDGNESAFIAPLSTRKSTVPGSPLRAAIDSKTLARSVFRSANTTATCRSSLIQFLPTRVILAAISAMSR